MYEAYLWEHRHYSWDELDSSSTHRQIVQEIDQMREEYDGRVFEDPLYLMQYTINWEDTNAAATFQSPENDAFLNAENEVYLRRVRMMMMMMMTIIVSLYSALCKNDASTAATVGSNWAHSMGP